MERQRLQAIESLQITGHSVKCQRCRVAVPIVGKLTKISNDRIFILQKKESGLRIILAVITTSKH
jgi:hypothetical protein